MKILHCKKSGGGQTVEDNIYPSGPWEPQIPQINKLFGEANNIYDGGGAQVYQGPQVAGLTGNLAQNQNQVAQYGQTGAGTAQAGQNAALTAATQGSFNPTLAAGGALSPALGAGVGNVGGTAGQQAGVLNQTLPGVTGALNANLSGAGGGLQDFSPGQTQAAGTDISGYLNNAVSGQGTMNPYLEQLVQGQANTATRAFNDNVLPALRQDSQAAGQPGGTRAGIAEGIAGSRLGEDITNITGQLYSNAFDRAQDTQNSAAGLVAGAQDSGAANQLQGSQLSTNYDVQKGQLGNQAATISNQFGQGANQGNLGINEIIAQLISQGGAQGVQQQSSGLSTLGNLLGAEGSVLSTANQGALQEQDRSQAILQGGIDQFNQVQNQPIQNLQQFQDFISGPYGSSIGGLENQATDQFNTALGQSGGAPGAIEGALTPEQIAQIQALGNQGGKLGGGGRVQWF